MSRLFIVGYPETWYMRVSDPMPPDEAIGNELVAKLSELAMFEAEMKWNTAARDYFSDWYNGLVDPDPGPKAAYLERKQDQMLRLAILLQLSWGPTAVLTRDAIEQSLAIIHSVEKDALRMIDYIAVEPRMRIVQRVIELLEVKNKISEAELMSEVWRYLSRAQEYDEVINMLMKTKQINVTVEEGEVYYVYKKKGA